MLTDADVCGDT
jgi:hypothetical protein